MPRVTDLIGDEYLNWKKGDQIIISTPTGSGKTTFIMRKLLLHACLQGQHVMYLCNRRALHDQSSSVLLFNIKAALLDDSVVQDQLRHRFNAATESLEAIADRCVSYFHVRTYQRCEKTGEYPTVMIKNEMVSSIQTDTTSQHKHVESLTSHGIIYPESIRYYIFDEAHYFVCDAQINPDTNYWDEKLKSPKGISVYLTATPEPLLCYLNRSRLDLTRLSNDLHEARDIPSAVYYDWEQNKSIRDTTLRKSFHERARNAYCQFVDKSLDGTYQNSFITYTAPTDYSYLTPYYFESYDQLFELIVSNYNTTDDKWVIFVDSIRNGEQLYLMLKYGIESLRKDQTNSNIAYLTAQTAKNNEYNGKYVYNQIRDEQKFGCRILITTNFLDCGVNLIDTKLKNVVISNVDQTAFLQMLGRVRKTGLGINLYLQSFKVNSILAYYNRYFKALENLSDLHLSTHPVPDVDHYNLGNYNANEADSLQGAFFSKKQLVSSAEARNANEQLNKTLEGAHIVNWIPIGKREHSYRYQPVVLIAGILNVLYSIYGYRKVIIANEQEEDPFAFLKIQLSWIGKTYDPTHWVNYHATRNELLSYLGELADSECLLYPTHQAEFVDRCLLCFMRFPLIPEAIKLDSSRYNFKNVDDSLYNDEIEEQDTDVVEKENTRKKSGCGKDKLNGVFWSEKIAFEIRSVRKYPKDHPSGITCWKIVRLSEEEMNKKTARRLEANIQRKTKRAETLKRKNEKIERKRQQEKQKKKSSLKVTID